MDTAAIGPSPTSTERAAREQELDKAAAGFEKLMLQRLLKDARRSGFGNETSNAQATYEGMYDEQVATLISERGSLGLADALRRSLGETGQIATTQPDQPDGGDGEHALSGRADGIGLDARSLATLRALMESSSDEMTAQTSLSGMPALPAATAGSTAAMDRALALPPIAGLAASTRSAGAATDAGSRRAFVEQLRPHAERTARKLGTTPDAVLAVAAHESGWGRHPITDDRGRDSNNLFGIKSHGHAGPSVTHSTTEYLGGQARVVDADFRRYPHPGASVQDFGDFLLENPRYGDALEVADRPERFLRGLQDAGYATDPNYADKAIRVMGEVRKYLQPEGDL